MVDASGATLAILTRAPSSGGKRRLFQTLGVQPDVELLRSLLLDTFDGTRLPGVRRVIAVTPGSACDEVRQIVEATPHAGGDEASLDVLKARISRNRIKFGNGLQDVPPRQRRGKANTAASEAERDRSGARVRREASLALMPQVEGDLGARMQAVMTELFAGGATPVAIIGSDLPHIVPDTIADAFDRLAQDREALVLGPARDGGYYLIGACRVPDVFTGMEWGRDDVLARTISAAVDRGFHVHQLPLLSDVDTAADLQAAVRSGRAVRTAAWMRAHVI